MAIKVIKPTLLNKLKRYLKQSLGVRDSFLHMPGVSMGNGTMILGEGSKDISIWADKVTVKSEEFNVEGDMTITGDLTVYGTLTVVDVK